MIDSPESVLAFWREAGSKKWFTKDSAFDEAIRARFLETYQTAAAEKLSGWERTAEGALALVIVLDQFPRNMFRGDARTYAADALARSFDRQVPSPEWQFFYLPFEHSESLPDQERCCALFAAAGDADLLKWAELHADIIRRFCRFPHRNGVLGRATTPEEQAFLDGGGFKG